MIVRFNYQSVLNHSEMYKSITRSVWGRNASEAQIVEGQCIFWTETERQVFVQTLPKALRTQALTALTSNLGLVALIQ